jgi:predicted Fe-Mo cluster-binding NifX family protein
MRIAVTAYGDKPESLVDLRFLVANTLVIYDTETNNWESHSVVRQGKKGWAKYAVQLVQRARVDVLLTGYIDRNSLKRLNGAGVAIYSAPELKACDAIADFCSGRLSQLLIPNAIDVDKK